MIGARRVRQGTGEFLARELVRVGCQVVGVVGTRPESLEETRQALAARYGIEARGYLTVNELVARERPDLVVVASPSEAHLEALEVALRAGCHVLCEKPLLWDSELLADDELRDVAEEMIAATAERLVDLADERGRLLFLNTQWPCTLDGFRALHGPPPAAPAELSLWLGPQDPPGPRMVQESGSHLLSLLYALCGAEGELEVVEVASPGADRLELDCRYTHPRGVTRARLLLRQAPAPPRPAAYEIDGRRVDREITLPGYTFSLVAGGRRVPIPDPMGVAVERFVAGVRAGARSDRLELVQGMRHLHRLVSAVPAALTAAPGGGGFAAAPGGGGFAAAGKE